MNNEPVAWAMFKDNTFMDAIHPDEHTRFEGGYTIPLYTHPAKTLADEDCIIPIWLARNFLESTDVPRFKRILEDAILKKASEK